MIGFFKNLFAKKSAAVPSPQVAPAPMPIPVAVATPPPPPKSPGSSTTALLKPKARIERVLLSLKAITDQFPPELASLIAEPPGPQVMIALPVDGILQQLSQGRVTVTIADLRKVAPPTTFISETAHDEQEVEIPLPELLAKLDPSLLKRKNQRHIEIPQDEADLFVRKPIPEAPGLPVNPAPSPSLKLPTEQLQQPAAPPPPAVPPAPPVIPPPPGIRLSLNEQPPAPPPATPPPPPAPPAPAAAATSFREPAPVPIPSLKLQLKEEGPAPEATAPSTPPAAAPPPPPPSIPLVLKTEPPLPAATPPPSPVSPLPKPPVSSPIPGDTIELPLDQVATQWPEAIREEVAFILATGRIHYPAAELEAALKRGKVTVTWERLRGWITPALTTPSLYTEAVVELPLPVVAPLFMARQSGHTPTRQKATIDESIPAPFARAGSEPPPTPAPETAAPAPATPGALGMDDHIPSQFIDKACALNGVAGSVIALKDGLLVAAKTPPEFQAETIAAFMPQVFSRVEAAAGSMQIGEFQTLMFMAGDRPWQIWKAGNLFFAAVGRPHELLPSAQLKIIAAQLARQTKA